QILPLGTLAIATPLTAAGFSVEIIDQRVNEDWRAKVRAAAAAKPVFFGVSSMTGVQIKGGLQASRIVKEVAPDVPVVWGGVHPSLLPDQTLAHPDVDIVVIGEGDATAPDLARALVEGRALDTVDGLGFKRDGAPLRTKPRALLEVEKLPSTDYTLIPDIDAYKVTAFYTGKASLAYQSSRGCAHPCGYCYNLEFNDMRFRARSPARVVDEIESLITRFDLKAVFMLDDNFFQSKRRVGEIAERILARGLDVEFYNANCRIDYISRYDVEFLKMLGRAGIRELRIGIESGSNTTQQRIDKYTTFDECLVANRKLREAGIVPHYNFMVGFPAETLTRGERHAAPHGPAPRREPGRVRLQLLALLAVPGDAALRRRGGRGVDAAVTARGLGHRRVQGPERRRHARVVALHLRRPRVLGLHRRQAPRAARPHVLEGGAGADPPRLGGLAARGAVPTPGAKRHGDLAQDFAAVQRVSRASGRRLQGRRDGADAYRRHHPRPQRPRRRPRHRDRGVGHSRPGELTLAPTQPRDGRVEARERRGGRQPARCRRRYVVAMTASSTIAAVGSVAPPPTLPQPVVSATFDTVVADATTTPLTVPVV
ncbi:MAG: B12-binding domain-containing radical SAM protein, partial [Deltaproteobacteria bacterium]|nr:B12-binding domain-containing radical SAM protein [Deltaproteobacteria bacterium]